MRVLTPVRGRAIIGDRVWLDVDGDGVQDPGELGLEGVEVKLYNDPDGDGVYDNLVATDTTGPDGSYIFDGLAPDDYVVVVNDGVTPAGYTQTGDPDDTLDNQSEPIVLAPGDVYVNADFGYDPAAGSTIGDQIYLDANGDGAYNPADGDYGIPGVTVTLLDDAGNVIATTTTDENGLYLFVDLLPGDYTVVFDTPAGFETVTQGERTLHEERDGRLHTRWVAEHPSDGLNLIANRYVVHDIAGPVDVAYTKNEDHLLEREYHGFMVRADYRFNASWVYGQPERFADRIRGARRIANPGCYATGAQLALAPLTPWLVGAPVVFGVSGYSGAGKKPSPKNDPEVLRDNLLPYALADHIHEREVSRHIARSIRFLPHVAPFFRGISLTVAATLAAGTSAAETIERFSDAYADCPLIRVRSGIPEVRQVRGTHGVIIGGFTVSESDARRLSIVAVLDNLLKGAATQAVQNLNLAFGLEDLVGIETTGVNET